MNGNTQSFPIVLGGSPNDHAQRFLELEAVMLDPPDSLLIKLLGSSGLHPSAALTYLDLLQLLPHDTERAVTSYGHLRGAGDFALWLECAAHRDIRLRATVFVEQAPPTLDLEHFAASQILIAQPMVWPADSEVLRRDWETCLSLISKHADFASVINRVLTPNDLREMLLIDSDCVDRLFAAPALTAAPIPNDQRSLAHSDGELGKEDDHAN